MAESWLAVGGLTLRLLTEDEQLVASDHPLMAPFRLAAPAADRRADITIRARFTDGPLMTAGTPRFEGGDAWLLHIDLAGHGEGAGDHIITCCTHGAARTAYKQARFNADLSDGEVVVSRRHFAAELAAGATISPLDYPLDEVLMIHALARGRGVAVHASGLRDASGRAFVFAGQSGAGKSTIARLLADVPGLTLLSDERLVIRTDGDQPIVFGTPWHGDALFVSAASGPLGGVFFLQQAPAHQIVAVSPAQASARLLACAFLPFHDRAAVDATCRAIEGITQAAPIAELRFAKHASVLAELVRDGGIAAG